MARLYLIGLLVFVTCAALVNGDVEELDDYDRSWDTDRSSCSDEYSDSSEESPTTGAEVTVKPPGELVCGPNESVSNCPIDCPSDYCPRSEAESKQTLFCPQPKVCPPPKCVCNFNHRRARNGTCIRTENCPPFRCSGPNEEYNACPPMCPSDDCSQATPTGKCPIIGRIGIVLICNPKCRCKKGYWRKNGKCVPYAQCSTGGEVTVKPPVQCGRNEVLRCVKKCPLERTCTRQVINYLCIRDPTPCQNKCVCADGYFRNSIGECITKEQCAKCTKPNEFFSCGSACDNECRTYPKQSRTNCPIKNIKCTERCYCNDGYARDDQGNCVPVDQCKKPSLNCGLNEVEICSTGCPPAKTCENRKLRYACPAVVLPCKPVCECKAGYYRNAIGDCITEAECAQCSKPNEFFSCGGACDNECKTLKKQSRNKCPIINIVCNRRCYCKDGYARDAKGNCIPIDQCNTGNNEPKCSDPNEAYVLGKSCPPDTCLALVARFKCDSNEPDAYRCRCKPGYFRKSAGSPCVPLCQCPQMANSPDCVAKDAVVSV